MLMWFMCCWCGDDLVDNASEFFCFFFRLILLLLLFDVQLLVKWFSAGQGECACDRSGRQWALVKATKHQAVVPSKHDIMTSQGHQIDRVASFA